MLKQQSRRFLEGCLRANRDQIAGHDICAGRAVKTMLRRFGLGGGKKTTQIGHAEVRGLLVALQQFAKLVRRQSQTRRHFIRLFFWQSKRILPPCQPVIDCGTKHKHHRRQPQRHQGKPRPSLECHAGVEHGQQRYRPARRMQGAQKHHNSDRAPHRDANQPRTGDVPNRD